MDNRTLYPVGVDQMIMAFEHTVSPLHEGSAFDYISASSNWHGDGPRGITSIIRRAHGAELEFDEAKTSGEMCDLAKRGDVVSLNVLLECGARVDAAECVPPAHGRAWHMATRGSLAPSPVS